MNIGGQLNNNKVGERSTKEGNKSLLLILHWERGGAVVRALSFYTDAPSSIPGKGKNQAIGRSPVNPAVNEYLVL